MWLPEQLQRLLVDQIGITLMSESISTSEKKLSFGKENNAKKASHPRIIPTTVQKE